MEPIASISRDDARSLVGMVFDLDDTITREGRIEAEALSALEALSAAGLGRVLVTGRPFGWTQVLARVLPIDAAAGENGAAWTWTGAGRRSLVRSIYVDDDLGRVYTLLEDVRHEVRRVLPEIELAADSELRRFDLAFDIGEHAHVEAAEVAALVACIEACGAQALVSSVHVHASASVHDKGAGALAAIEDALGAELADPRRWLFVGDSGNDATAFGRFPLSAGPSNVASHLPRLPTPPRFVATLDRGRGFAEIVRHVLEARR